ncbi:MAG: hypothetical protein Q8Q09_10240 [Deltaproteobacteria bacterium]|nr:hypothetical protein [Deltaproteobacteria bacterium]
MNTDDQISLLETLLGRVRQRATEPRARVALAAAAPLATAAPAPPPVTQAPLAVKAPLSAPVAPAAPVVSPVPPESSAAPEVTLEAQPAAVVPAPPPVIAPPRATLAKPTRSSAYVSKGGVSDELPDLDFDDDEDYEEDYVEELDAPGPLALDQIDTAFDAPTLGLDTDLDAPDSVPFPLVPSPVPVAAAVPSPDSGSEFVVPSHEVAPIPAPPVPSPLAVSLDATPLELESSPLASALPPSSEHSPVDLHIPRPSPLPQVSEPRPQPVPVEESIPLVRRSVAPPPVSLEFRSLAKPDLSVPSFVSPLAEPLPEPTAPVAAQRFESSHTLAAAPIQELGEAPALLHAPSFVALLGRTLALRPR